MNFSERIVFCRKKAMLSQEELANRLGVSRQAVSKWETGESIPDMNNLASLAEIFGVSLDWLIKGEEEKCEERPNDKPPFEVQIDSMPFIGCSKNTGCRSSNWCFFYSVGTNGF